MAENTDLNKVETSAKPRPFMAWGKYVKALVADVTANILGFVPNGLEFSYDVVLKNIPLLGRLFAHSWIEDTLKLVTGITIGKEVAKDLGEYLFGPLAFIFGLPIALFTDKAPVYQGEIGALFKQLSGQTVLGSLLGALAAFSAVYFQAFEFAQLKPISSVLIGAAGGALLGLLSKTMMLVAMDAVTRANAASSRLNAKRAQKLAKLLNERLKEEAHAHVYRHARGIIEQIHGPQIESHLQSFFSQYHDKICEHTFSKIDRHLSYLSDRATHGDMESLKKLYRLYKMPAQKCQELKSMLERILNNEEIFKLQDLVDNYYDEWTYQSLKAA